MTISHSVSYFLRLESTWCTWYRNIELWLTQRRLGQPVVALGPSIDAPLTNLTTLEFVFSGQTRERQDF